MIPSDLASRLRLLTESVVNPVSPVHETPAELPELPVGQRFTARSNTDLEGAYFVASAGPSFGLRVAAARRLTLLLGGGIDGVLGVQRLNTSRLIAQLEVRGLIMRRRDEVDRRIVNLSLTDAGHAVATELMPRTVQFWNDMLAEFTTDEASTLIELLSRLLTRMEAEPMATMKNAAKQRVPKTK